MQYYPQTSAADYHQHQGLQPVLSSPFPSLSLSLSADCAETYEEERDKQGKEQKLDLIFSIYVEQHSWTDHYTRLYQLHHK